MIKIASFYPSHLNKNSDGANLKVLVRWIKLYGLKAEVIDVPLGNIDGLPEADILLFNSGLNSSLPLLAQDLIEHKQQYLNSAVAKNKSILAIASGFYLLGKKIRLIQGAFQGLGLLPLEYEETPHRHVGNSIISFAALDKPLVGFSNHRGNVFLHDEAQAFGQVVKGYGNDQERKFEGCTKGNIWATHLHGPFLVYNPHFVDYLLKETLARKNLNQIAFNIDDEAEWLAYDKIKERAYNGV